MKKTIRHLFTATWIRILVINLAAVAIGILTEALYSRLGAGEGIDWSLVPRAWEFWTVVACAIAGIIHQVLGTGLDSQEKQRLEAKLDQILANTAPAPTQPQPAPKAVTVASPKCTIRFSKLFGDAYAKLDKNMQTWSEQFCRRHNRRV